MKIPAQQTSQHTPPSQNHWNPIQYYGRAPPSCQRISTEEGLQTTAPHEAPPPPQENSGGMSWVQWGDIMSTTGYSVHWGISWVHWEVIGKTGVLVISPTLIMVSPQCAHSTPQCTEHLPAVLMISPTLIMVSPDVLNEFPSVLNIPQCTA